MPTRDVLTIPGVSVVERCQTWGNVVRGSRKQKQENQTIQPGKLSLTENHPREEIQKSPIPVPKRTHLRNQSWGYAKESSLPLHTTTKRRSLPNTAANSTPPSEMVMNENNTLSKEYAPTIKASDKDDDSAKTTKSMESVLTAETLPSNPAHKMDKQKTSHHHHELYPSLTAKVGTAANSPCSSGQTVTKPWRKEKQGQIAKSFSHNDMDLYNEKPKKCCKEKGTVKQKSKDDPDDLLVTNATEELKEAVKLIRSFNMDMINQFVQKK
jgi:hypothetical protein